LHGSHPLKAELIGGYDSQLTSLKNPKAIAPYKAITIPPATTISAIVAIGTGWVVVFAVIFPSVLRICSSSFVGSSGAFKTSRAR
jgi:hypothetical protein